MGRIEMALILPSGVGIAYERCNIYGAETGGAQYTLGGLEGAPTHQWYCKHRSVGKFRMECEHGHKGQPMPLCTVHIRDIKSRDIEFCPRCNTDPENGHRCTLLLTEIS